MRGLVINRFGRDGIFIAGFNTNIIEGNFIGTDLSGTEDLGNGNNGVGILDSGNNMIGGATPEARNLISGNKEAGVFIGGEPSQFNRIETMQELLLGCLFVRQKMNIIDSQQVKLSNFLSK